MKQKFQHDGHNSSTTRPGPMKHQSGMTVADEDTTDAGQLEPSDRCSQPMESGEQIVAHQPAKAFQVHFNLSSIAPVGAHLTIVEDRDDGACHHDVRFSAESLARVLCLGSAESLPSLRRGFRAWVWPSLRRVSGSAWVLGFCRVYGTPVLQPRSSRIAQPLPAAQFQCIFVVQPSTP